MRLLTSRTRGLPNGPVSDATLAKLYAFPKAHWLRANFVSTLDGSAQGPDGLSGTINTSADKRVFSANRRLADCVMVGAGTARAENYRPAQIPLVIVSRRGRLPESLRESRNRVVLATCAPLAARQQTMHGCVETMRSTWLPSWPGAQRRVCRESSPRVGLTSSATC